MSRTIGYTERVVLAPKFGDAGVAGFFAVLLVIIAAFSGLGVGGGWHLTLGVVLLLVVAAILVLFCIVCLLNFERVRIIKPKAGGSRV